MSSFLIDRTLVLLSLMGFPLLNFFLYFCLDTHYPIKFSELYISQMFLFTSHLLSFLETPLLPNLWRFKLLLIFKYILSSNRGSYFSISFDVVLCFDLKRFDYYFSFRPFSGFFFCVVRILFLLLSCKGHPLLYPFLCHLLVKFPDFKFFSSGGF